MSLTLRASGTTRSIDTDAVRCALAILADPANGCEIRALPTGKSIVCPGNDLSGLVWAVEQMPVESAGIYYALNPVPANLAHGARVGDVLSRRWLLVDIDPERPTDCSATNEEKEAARLVTVAVMEWLTALGWPAPVIVDSGNGWHLLYRIDLPNNDHARALVREFLYALAERFNDETAGVDKSVHNASRIAKLPGTWARKGPHSPERPHRMAKVQSAPDEAPVVVAAEQIVAATKAITENQAQVVRDHQAGLRLCATANSRAAYAEAALAGEVARVRLAMPGPKGGRNNALNRAAFSMGQLVAAGAILQAVVECRLLEAGLGSGLTEPETRATIRSGMVAGMKEPREIPERNGTHSPASEPASSTPGDLVIVRASQVMPRKVEWLWPGRIPLGKLTTFAGMGGLGKTFVLCHITAIVSTGGEWPHSGGECCQPGQTLFLSGEDDPDDTLVPRLIECGADLSKVCFLQSAVQNQFTLNDLKTLDVALSQIGPNVRFVVIDPPSCFLGEADDHKNAEVRALLSPLQSWAAKHRLGVVFNTHFNKSGGANVEAAMRVMGSVAWVNAVRAAHIFARDPDDQDRVLFVPLKMNLAKRRKALAYKITETTDDMAKVEWLGEVDTTADQAASRQSSGKRMKCTDWVIERFREKLEWPSKEIFRLGKNQEGYCERTMFAAKATLEIPARISRHANGDEEFIWWVPPDWPPLQSVPNPHCSLQSDKEDEWWQ